MKAKCVPTSKITLSNKNNKPMNEPSQMQTVITNQSLKLTHKLTHQITINEIINQMVFCKGRRDYQSR